MAGVGAGGGEGTWARLLQSRGWSRSPTCSYLQIPPSAFSSLDPFREFRAILALLDYSLYLSWALCGVGRKSVPEFKSSSISY